MKLKDYGLQALVVLVGALLVYYAAQRIPVQSWDEARRGVNALLMWQSGDYWNYRYVDGFDAFNTKPPLFTWLASASMREFGVTLTALRMPSQVCALLFIAVVYRLSLMTADRVTALLTSLILLAVNGIFGLHVAFTGDTDMLFVFTLTMGMWATYFWVRNGKPLPAYWAVVWFALAFLTKGLALLLMLPGLAAWVALNRRQVRHSAGQWAGLVVFALLVLVGILTVLARFGTGGDAYPNLLVAMFENDGARRFTDASFETGYKWDYLPVVLDIKFGIFVYVLYAYAAYVLFTGRVGEVVRGLGKGSFTTLSLLVIANCFCLLLLSQNKHEWYVAPVIFPLAYLTARVMVVTGRKLKFPVWLLLALAAVPLPLKFAYLSDFGGRNAPLVLEVGDELPYEAVARFPVGIRQDCVFRVMEQFPQCNYDPLSHPPALNGPALDSLHCESHVVKFYPPTETQ